MNHKQAENYVEAILFAKKSIESGVIAARQNAVAKHRENLGTHISGGKIKDPTSEEVMKKLEPIPVLRFMDEGKTYQVAQPEKWLEVFSKSLASFRQRYGDRAYKTIEQRYIMGMECLDVAKAGNVSRRAFNARRTAFLAVLMVYAAQYGLIKLDD